MPPTRPVNEQEQWYDRAAEMRTLAVMMSDVNAKRMMLTLAEDYEARGDRAAK
jgi:hypothetical protein